MRLRDVRSMAELRLAYPGELQLAAVMTTEIEVRAVAALEAAQRTLEKQQTCATMQRGSAALGSEHEAACEHIA